LNLEDVDTRLRNAGPSSLYIMAGDTNMSDVEWNFSNISGPYEVTEWYAKSRELGYGDAARAAAGGIRAARVKFWTVGGRVERKRRYDFLLARTPGAMAVFKKVGSVTQKLADERHVNDTSYWYEAHRPLRAHVYY
jgi:hypothetical protein